MLCEGRNKLLTVCAFVSSILSPFNVVALFFTLRLLSFKLDENFPVCIASYTKCAVLFYTTGLFGTHALREFVKYWELDLQCRTPPYFIQIIDIVCNISMYTQPIACFFVMLYGHYIQKTWMVIFEQSVRDIEQQELEDHRARRANAIPNDEPVVIGRPVVHDTLTHFEQAILEVLQEITPSSRSPRPSLMTSPRPRALSQPSQLPLPAEIPTGCPPLPAQRL